MSVKGEDDNVIAGGGDNKTKYDIQDLDDRVVNNE